MSVDDALKQIEKHIETIENTDIYYTLKKLKVRYTSEATIRAIKIFIACKYYGIDIVTSSIFYYFYGSSRTSALSQLHILGDKGILTLLKGNSKGLLRYMLSEKFNEHFYKNTEHKKLNTGSDIG